MKKLALIALMLVTLSFGCKKDEEVVDPRDQFIATYNSQMVVSIPSINFQDSHNGTSIFTKESASGRIKITYDDGTILYANVSGNSYVYEKYSQTQTIEGQTVSIEVTGAGTINGATINETGVYTMHALGQNFVGTWTCTHVKQ
jgi:hypothetical protein